MENKVEKLLEKRSQDIKEEWKDIRREAITICESPIEKLFLIEWEYQTEAQAYPEYFYIMPQYKINNYRVDFMIYFNTDKKWMDKEYKYPESQKEKSLIVENFFSLGIKFFRKQDYRICLGYLVKITN